MNYAKKEIKKGITIHNIVTNKFKTNLYAVFLTIPLTRENITKEALIAAILRRGTQNIQSQDLISKKLEEMYGASFDCGIEKTGDNHIMKFYLEAINEDFLPEREELTKKSLNILFDIIFNPLIIKDGFKPEYVNSEKNKLKQIIESKINDKRRYSFERCVEEMFKGKPYGLYKYGYIDDLEKITPSNLLEYYREFIDKCKIDILTSGDNNAEEMFNIIEENEQISKLKEREAVYVVDKNTPDKLSKEQEKIVEEHMQVGQGNLVLGLRVNSQKENARYITSVYNAILGGGANSKLFQNVREKNSLAYTASSTFRRQKNAIFIRCGIEIDKYEKALNTIKEQVQDMADGNFTEDDMANAKNLIVAAVKGTTAEQDAEITYYFTQELAENFTSIEDYIKKIEDVSKQDIIELAKDVWIDTIYFLRD